MGANGSAGHRACYYTEEAIAVFEGRAVHGVVKLTALEHGGTRIQLHLTGLSPGEHGFHIHTLGNPLDGCKAACAHFNPDGCVHGGPKSAVHHAGDLGNIIAGEDGVAKLDSIFSFVALNGPRSVIGRSLIVHADPDDLGLGGRPGTQARAESLKTGNAGVRLGCAVIGIAKERPPIPS